jgi:hypothetical protein
MILNLCPVAQLTKVPLFLEDPVISQLALSHGPGNLLVTEVDVAPAFGVSMSQQRGQADGHFSLTHLRNGHCVMAPAKIWHLAFGAADFFGTSSQVPIPVQTIQRQVQVRVEQDHYFNFFLWGTRFLVSSEYFIATLRI